MAGSDPNIDLTPFVNEIFRDVSAELESRLSILDGLSDRDLLAINTAIVKAAWRGVLRGSAEQVQALNELPNVDIRTWIHRPEGDEGEPDPWADEYGHGDAEETDR